MTREILDSRSRLPVNSFTVQRSAFTIPVNPLWAAFAFSAIAATACGDEFSSCAARKTCPAGGATGAGASSHPDNAGASGDGGTSGGTKGTGGATTIPSGGSPQAGANEPGDGGAGGRGVIVGAGGVLGSGGGPLSAGGTTSSGGTIASSGAGGAADASAMGTLNQPCTEEGALACQGHASKQQLICSLGKWTANGTCSGKDVCDTTRGVNAGSCQPAASECSGKDSSTTFCRGASVLACGADQVATITQTCGGETPLCFNGACVECIPGSKRCSGNGVQTCSATNTWSAALDCPGATPLCQDGSCTTPPSCAGLAPACARTGANIDSCCNSPLVTGGVFNRGNDASYPATVGDFRLDAFEITVGRFKRFFAAYSPNMIPAGAGKNPNNPSDLGWDVAWNVNLPANSSALSDALHCDPDTSTWDASDENLPINCITWYVAKAFCIWDGGRLPTEAEWNYAAAGGSEQRAYPWGSAVPGSDGALAVYGSYWNNPEYTSPLKMIAPVGSILAGRGRWGQADLAGNMAEWTEDVYSPSYLVPCNNCANTGGADPERVLRGGYFMTSADSLLTSSRDAARQWASWFPWGARCARDR